MTKAQLKDRLSREHVDYMQDASDQVEIVKGHEGRWDVRCYDAHGSYIGGISNVTGLLVARTYAELYAITLTQSIERRC